MVKSMRIKPRKQNRAFLLKKGVKRYIGYYQDIEEYELNYAIVSKEYRPKSPCCGNKQVTMEGQYYRKKIVGTDKEKIAIKRYQCKKCKKTFGRLPPFLIRYKRYYLPYFEAGIWDIVVNRTAILKSAYPKEGNDYEASTIYRYTRYFLDRSYEIYEQMKNRVLEWLPGFQYEKNFDDNGKRNSRYERLKQGFILAQTFLRFLQERFRLPKLGILTLIQHDLMSSNI